MLDLRRTAWLVGSVVALPTGVLIGRTYGWVQLLRYLSGLAVALAAHVTYLQAIRHRVPPEPVSPADLLTVSRVMAGDVLAGLVLSGVQDGRGPAGWLGWLVTLWGATLSDWLDGPLARRAGPSRLGGVLDIEADSWLTLWSAAGAVAWGGLPHWCLLPPTMRYVHPLLDVLLGGLPAGGGPWWSRVTGTAQMALILTALAPTRRRLRDRALALATRPVSGGQLITVLLLLVRRRAHVRTLLQRHGPPAVLERSVR